MNFGRVFPFAFLASLVLAGCDSQVDPDYRGEPLATLHGSVVAASQAPASGDAVIVWQNPSGSPDLSIGVSVPVSGSFPASFTMPIYTPPPAEAVIYVPEETGDDRVAVGIIAMLKTGTDLADLQNADDDALLGLCEDHVVVHIENELQAGSYWETILGGRPAPGYHLMEVVRKTPAEKEAYYTCQQDSNDANTACLEACNAITDISALDACLTACDAEYAAIDCGGVHDTFRASQSDFETSITVNTPSTQFINWY